MKIGTKVLTVFFVAGASLFVGHDAQGDPSPMIMAVGDFDNDGHQDYALGDPTWENGASCAHGAVHIWYNVDTYDAYGDSPDETWHRDSSGILESTGCSDEFGASVAVGDIDDDGYDDLIIGVPGDVVNSYSAAGSIHVIYGSAAGLTDVDDQVFHQDTTNIEDSAEAGDRFGSAVTAGDFDGDGYADVAIGASGEGVSSISGAGGVNIIYGTSTGLSATDDQFFTQNTTGVDGIAETDDHFGEALSSGDYDNDGYWDLAIGVPSEADAASSQGAVNVLYGTSSGISATNDDLFLQGVGGIEGTGSRHELFGWFLRSIPGTYDELRVWAPGTEELQVIPGSSSGLDSGSDTNASNVAPPTYANTCCTSAATGCKYKTTCGSGTIAFCCPGGKDAGISLLGGGNAVCPGGATPSNGNCNP